MSPQRDVELPAPAGPAGWLWLLAALLVAGLAHAPAMSAQWLTEDTYLVREADVVAQGVSGARRVLAGGLTFELKDGQTVSSLVLASLALDGARASDSPALDPAPFHTTQWVLHLLITALLFVTLRVLGPGQIVWAGVATLVYASHPLVSGGVVGLAGRGALLAALFSLLSTLSWLKLGRSWLWLPLLVLTGVLAMWAHPTAFGLPLALGLLMLAVPRARRPAPLAMGAALGLLLLCAITLAVSISGGHGSFEASAGSAPASLPEGLAAVSRLGLAFVLPVGLPGAAGDEGASPGTGLSTATTAAMGVTLALLLVVLLRAAAGRARAPDLCVGVLLALALPAALALPSGVLLDPRHAVLLVLPLAILPACAARAALEALNTPLERRFALALSGSLAVVALGALTWTEGRAWADEVARTQRVLRDRPRHLGALLRMARHERSSAELLRLQAADLPGADPRREQLTQQRLAGLEVALATARRATRHPDGRRAAASWEEYGHALLALERVPEALQALNTALGFDSAVQQHSAAALRAERPEAQRLAAADLLRALARARAATGDPEGAADAFAKAAALAPGDDALQEQAGLSLWGVNRFHEALAHLLSSVELARSPAERRRRGELLERARAQAREQATRWRAEAETALAAGDIAGAVRAWESALDADATDVKSRMQAGWWRGHYFGNYALAHQLLEQADRLLEAQGQPADGGERRWIQEKRALLREQLRQEDEEAAREGAR